jgi:hypothetical protein
MTLTSIRAFIEKNDLAFLGFDLNSEVIDTYRRRFPNDTAATDLDQWRAFERDNPATFVGMYQFWVRKAS